jgi:endoglucanase
VLLRCPRQHKVYLSKPAIFCIFDPFYFFVTIRISFPGGKYMSLQLTHSGILACLLSVMVLPFISIDPIRAQEPPVKKTGQGWWNQGYRGRPKTIPGATLLPRIKVFRNKLVNSKGDTLLFRGLSIADPDKLADQGHWNRQLFEELKEMGAMLVRIPVHPVAWRERGPDSYLSLLDSAVAWCTGLGLYLDIDWHSIGNLEMELFQDPMYNTTKRETFEFWRMIARHFNGNNTVAFYELFNEPTTYRGQLGNISWTEWKKINEDIIQLIRAYDPETIPIVAGFDWAYDLTPLREEPISAAGIVYTTHPYSNKRQPPWEPKWDEDFGFAAARYPIIATEFGFGLASGLQVGPDDYGNQIIRYLESRGIGWMAWVFDPEWQPALLKSWDNYQLTGAGEFFKKALHGQNGKP